MSSLTRNAPRVVIAELEPDPSEDWYSPKILALKAKEVRVTLGRKRAGLARVTIMEGEWERRHVHVSIEVEGPYNGAGPNGWGKAIGGDGTMTGPQIDKLIEALTLARAEAHRLGLFTPRPTPTNIEDVLFAVGGSSKAGL